MFSKNTKAISLITAAFVAASVFTSCASEETPETEPSIPESSIEESVTETSETTKKPTPTPTPTPTETMSEEDELAYDYNLVWDMIEEGYSDSEIMDALMEYGYENNEDSAEFLLEWVKDDYDSDSKEYDAPDCYPGLSSILSGSSGSGSSSSSGGSSSSGSSSGSGSSSSGSSSSGSESSSGSGSSSSGGSSSGSNNSGSGETASTTQTAPAETEAPTDPAPAETTPQATEPAPTETEPAPTISYYELNCTAFDDEDNQHSNTFTGGSKSDVGSQYTTWLDNHGYSGGSYTIYAVYSDGTKKPA